MNEKNKYFCKKKFFTKIEEIEEIEFHKIKPKSSILKNNSVNNLWVWYIVLLVLYVSFTFTFTLLSKLI